MRRTMMALVFVFALTVGALPAAAASTSSELAPLHRAAGEAVPGEYIVVFDDGVAAASAVDSFDVEARHVFEHALSGFSAALDDRQLEIIRQDPRVAFVEENQVVTTATRTDVPRDRERVAESLPDVGAANQWAPPSWGLDRIDQRNRPLDNWYHYNQTAGNVDIYIVDTGIDWNHPHIHRTLAGYDAFGGNSHDCNGHGTHVAGTAASPHYGVAKGAWLWSVRVLNCAGSGSWDGIIAGTDWVRHNMAQWPGYFPIANYSLGGGYSAAVNQAIDNLSNAGATVVVAAGNSYGADACNFSPASASTAVTVASSNVNDANSWFTNVGPCVDLYAPGENITSAWLNGGQNTISGTSMASPHVAGVAAMFKASHGNHHWSTVRNWLTQVSTHNVLSGVPAGTPNRLLFTNGL